MTTFVYSHPDIFLHDAAAEHCAMEPDRIARIYAKVARVPDVVLKAANEASREQLERNHTPEFVERLLSCTPTRDGAHHHIDRETALNRHTWRTLVLSAGAACQAVDAVQNGHADNAFCVTYAGHHAMSDAAGGFCFINTAAIAARHALASGSRRVAVLDIDTHSGNGTVLSFMDEPRVVFAETYQPGYPGSFLPGFCPSNIHRVRCDSRTEFRRGWERMLTEVADFDPDLIIVSAGFDAHVSDPLGTIGLVDDDYRWVAREILAVTANIVACLEGGYNVETTSRCAAAFVEEMTRRS